MMRLPHPIPYQGSKRNLASHILRFFPKYYKRLIEPFAGSAAISIASAYYFKSSRFFLNDINKPLMELWNDIINKPETIIKRYHDLWFEQIGKEEEFYYNIREKFNITKKPEFLLFLLAKCVKAAVRYNNSGKFNQSPDKRRLGRKPEMMREDILNVSKLLKFRTELSSKNYFDLIDNFANNDLIYLDPPYHGTGISGGFNYHSNIDHNLFIEFLKLLNKKNIPFILSYDGRTDKKVFGGTLPEFLELHKIEINAGRSSQATLLKRNNITYESVYLSPVLIEKLQTINDRDNGMFQFSSNFQNSLFTN